MGKPMTSPSMLNTIRKGTLSNKNNVNDSTTNFCSCLFFIVILFDFKNTQKQHYRKAMLF